MRKKRENLTDKELMFFPNTQEIIRVASLEVQEKFEKEKKERERFEAIESKLDLILAHLDEGKEKEKCPTQKEDHIDSSGSMERIITQLEKLRFFLAGRRKS